MSNTVTIVLRNPQKTTILMSNTSANAVPITLRQPKQTKIIKE